MDVFLASTFPSHFPSVRAVLGPMAEFERECVRERIVAGLDRAPRAGRRLGRPRWGITTRELRLVEGLSLRAAARELTSPNQ
jgi:DNA invertase Pin-like site-specific DNA recombinase